MKKKCMSKKIVSLVIMATLFNNNLVYASKIVEKNETVYVELTNLGSPKKKTVSDWLHTDNPKLEIKDKTTLKTVKNVKDDDMPIKKENTLIWNTNKNDIFYQGDTEKKLPVEINISYYLDDKIVMPDELAGKSGKLKIRIHFINNDIHTVNVNSGSKNVYTPFTSIATINLPIDTFKNVKVSEGEVLSDGNNQVVTFIGFPGLNESLQLGKYGLDGLKDLDFPQSFEVLADVKNFEMGPIMFAVTPEIPDMDKLKSAEDLDELRNGLEDLKDASKKLVDGSYELSDALCMLRNKLEESQEDMDEMDPNEEIRSLITNADRLERERLLVKDAFDFYDMDKLLLDLAPKYVIDKNIKLYDKVTEDVDDVDVDYVLDDPFFRTLPDQFTDEDMDNAKKLLDDTSDFKGELKKHEGDINTLRSLLSYSTDMTDILKKLNSLNLSNTLEFDENGNVNYNKIITSLIESNINNKVDEIKNSIDDNGKIKDDATKALMNNIISKSLDFEINRIKSNAVDSSCLSYIKEAISQSKDETQKKQLIQLLKQAEILIKNPEALGENAPKVEVVVKKTVTNILGQSKAILTGAIQNDMVVSPIKEKILNIISKSINMQGQSVMNQISSPISEIKSNLDKIDTILNNNLNSHISLSNEINEVILKAYNLDKNMKKTIGADYGSKIESSANYAKSLIPKINDILDDLDENQGNIAIINNLVRKYDDPKIKYFKKRFHDLLDDLDEVRPILDDLKEELDDPEMNKSFHNSPETVDTLMKMKDDLEDNKKIIEIIRDALEEHNIELANKLVDALPNLHEGVNELYDGSKTLADNMNKFDDSGIHKLSDKLDDKLDDADDIVDTKDALVSLSDNYKTFTDISSDMSGKVKFVMKTEEIKLPEIKSNKQEPVKDSGGLLGWIKSIAQKIKSVFN